MAYKRKTRPTSKRRTTRRKGPLAGVQAAAKPKKMVETIVQGFIVAVGVVGGSMVMTKIVAPKEDGTENTIPKWIPGAVGVAGGLAISAIPNKYCKAAGIGIVSAGSLDLTKKLTDGQESDSIGGKVNAAIPALSGTEEEEYEERSLRDHLSGDSSLTEIMRMTV